MKYGLIGEKLGHSFSREIHDKLGWYDYELREIPRDGLAAFFGTRDFAGINVTIPYKTDVIPFLDGMTERAKAVGAVNTISNRGGKLFGDNTDVAGLVGLIKRMRPDLSGLSVLIAGTGGTSRAALVAARELGAEKVYRVSRTGREGALTYEDAYRDHADAGFLINTTPVGMYPHPEGKPVDLARLPRLLGVVDAIYNPLETRLLREARARGIPAENGLYMLVCQAMRAAEFWTGDPVDDATTERIYSELLCEKRNVVLIGMPGSGKTTVGSILAKRLGRELFDTDRMIVSRAGIPIPEIFRTRGETVFRDYESEAVEEASAGFSRVLSTGGGAILRPDNLIALKRNGTVIFLDRPPEELTPTDDRPLADQADKIKALYEARYPLYLAAADAVVGVCGTPEETAKQVMEKLQ